MAIEHVLAVVPTVTDFEASHAWYERFFGRAGRQPPHGGSARRVGGSRTRVVSGSDHNRCRARWVRVREPRSGHGPRKPRCRAAAQRGLGTGSDRVGLSKGVSLCPPRDPMATSITCHRQLLRFRTTASTRDVARPVLSRADPARGRPVFRRRDQLLRVLPLTGTETRQDADARSEHPCQAGLSTPRSAAIARMTAQSAKGGTEFDSSPSEPPTRLASHRPVAVPPVPSVCGRSVGCTESHSVGTRSIHSCLTQLLGREHRPSFAARPDRGLSPNRALPGLRLHRAPSSHRCISEL